MGMNRIQFQPGSSLPAFHAQFGTEERQCADVIGSLTLRRKASALPGVRRRRLLSCSRVGSIRPFQCKGCRLQTSLIAGTLFQSTHLALSIWFLAIYLVSQAKTDLSALDLKRQLGVSYPKAWLIQQK